MTKKEQIKNYINKNYKWLLEATDDCLDNNYGLEVQFPYSLINKPKDEFYEEDSPYNYRAISYRDAVKIKNDYITAVMDIIKIDNYGVSESTIRKALSEIDFYDRFNTDFVERLNGEEENVEMFKRTLKRR